VDATCVQYSNEFATLTKRSGQEGAVGALEREIVLRADIGNVERAMLAHPAIVSLISRPRIANGYGTKMRSRNQRAVLVEPQHHVINPTNPGGALDNCIEHRLNIRRRAADDAEHLGGCRLMLQGLAQFCVALLDLLEQSHVLYSDDGLVSKCFQQFDLRRTEGTYLAADGGK